MALDAPGFWCCETQACKYHQSRTASDSWLLPRSHVVLHWARPSDTVRWASQQETDSPYLTPHPFRSQRPNEPRLVVHTAECLAQARGMSLADLATLTTANARELFRRR